MHGVDCGVRWFAVDQWDGGVFKALDKLIDSVGRHVWGGGVGERELITN